MIASVVAAVLLPFILVIVMLLSIMDGASSHNVSAVDQVFLGRSDLQPGAGGVPEIHCGYADQLHLSWRI